MSKKHPKLASKFMMGAAIAFYGKPTFAKKAKLSGGEA